MLNLSKINKLVNSKVFNNKNELEPLKKDNSLIKMGPWYVYTLIDPFDNKIFYVGKGKGRRSEEHEKAVKNGTEVNKKKKEKINQILDRGDEVMDRVIGRYHTAEEALAVESTLIKWVYGLRNLTNVVHGHQHKNIRSFGNYKIIKGLDIEKNILPTDHAFTKELQIDAERYDINEKLIFLRYQLHKYDETLEISMPDFQKKKDPAIFVKLNGFARLQLMMRTNGADNVILNVRAIEMKRKHNQEFIRKYQNIFDIKMKNSNDSYFKLDEWKGKKAPHYLNDIGLIIKNVKTTLSIVKNA